MQNQIVQHPLIGAFPEVLDSSMMASFKSCHQLFKKIYIDQWKSAEEKVDLHAGKAFASGIEAARRAFYEQGLPAPDAYAIGLRALSVAYGDFSCPPESPKSHDRVLSALAYYFDYYPFNHSSGYPLALPDGRRAIEMSFAHPIDVLHPLTGQPILYCGRADAINFWAGDNWITDEKTTKSLGPSWAKQWDLRSQFLGYTWGFRKMDWKVAGVLVRGVSILKTKHETTESANYFSPWEVDRWYRELCFWVRMMIACWQSNTWLYNLDHSCSNYGGCGFREVCKVQDEGPWLRQFFQQRFWDPRIREEKVLSEEAK